MIVESKRFGVVEIPDEEILHFPSGMLGFGDCKRFALHGIEGEERLGFLQSVDRPDLAFPVLDARVLEHELQESEINSRAREAGLPGSDLEVLVLVAVRGERLVANLLAPVVIDVEHRTGAQIVLDRDASAAQRVIAERRSAVHHFGSG